MFITVSSVYHDPNLCFTFGQTHYKTFDGKYFYFPGKCKYSLVEDCEIGGNAIQVVNDPKCTHLTDCARSVHIYFGETVIKVDNQNLFYLNVLHIVKATICFD